MLEDRAGVGHAVIQPQRVEVVTEIIVGADVAPGPGTGVSPQQVNGPLQQAKPAVLRQGV